MYENPKLFAEYHDFQNVLFNVLNSLKTFVEYCYRLNVCSYDFFVKKTQKNFRNFYLFKLAKIEYPHVLEMKVDILSK